MFQKIKMDHALLSRHFFHTAVKLIAKEKNPSHISLGELLFFIYILYEMVHEWVSPFSDWPHPVMGIYKTYS